MSINKKRSSFRKKTMMYDYVDNPPQPTGPQNKFVLKKLLSSSKGITSVELVGLGVADPRPRIRDLRELGWNVQTIQPDPHVVATYVLMAGGGD